MEHAGVVAVFCEKLNAYWKLFAFAFIALAFLAGALSADATVNLTFPEAGANLSQNDSDFIFNFTSNNSTTLNCSLWLNYNSTGWYLETYNASAANGSETAFPNVSLSGQGSYAWYVNCSGTNSSTRNLYVDTLEPGITIFSPAEGSVFDPAAQNITFSISNEPDAAGLFVNVSAFNSTNDLANWSTNATVLVFPNYSVQLGLPNGTYKISAFVRDRSNNTGMQNVTGVYVGPAVIHIYLMSPESGYAVSNRTNITFAFNFTSTSSSTMLCSVNVNNSTGLYAAVIDSQNFTRNQVYYPQSSSAGSNWPDGAYTWYVNCTNVTSGENATSAVWNFTIDSSSPLISTAHVAEPDLFYSNYPGNDVININVTINGTGSNISSAVAQLYNQSSALWNQATLACNSTTLICIGSMNVSANISSLKASGAINSNSPVAGFGIVIEASDQAGNNGSDSSSISQVMLHDLGSFQGPPGNMSACVREGTGTTNMSHVLDFNNVNFTQVMQINGSAYCNNLTQGNPDQLPWGDTFKTVGQITLYGVNMSTQEQAGQVMGAMGNLIRIQIAKPHSFGQSRVYVNTSGNYTYLNRSATVSLYDLPFNSAPSVVYDGGAASVNLTWSQGPFNSSFNCSLGNLTMNVTGFSGYNVTDNVSPAISVLQPAANFNTSSTSVTINVSANGTTSEISALYINVSSGGATYNYTTYAYGGANTAGCSQIAPGSENVTCQITVPLSANLRYTLNVTAYDYGNVSPGNSYSASQTFTIDTAGPTLTLNSPANQTNTTNANYTFNWTATDALGANFTCALYVDGAANRTGLAVNNSSAATTTATAAFAQGPHSWYVNCSDGAGNAGISETRTLTVDTGAPTLALNLPVESANSSTANVTFNWTANDTLLGISCNLTIDGSVNRASLAVTNATAYTTTSASALATGSHNWSVTCWDGASNSASSETRNLTILAVAGNASTVNATGYGTVNVSINGTALNGTNYSGSLQVNITTDNGSLILSYSYNFSYVLNFTALNLTNGTSGGKSYLVINGANASGGLNSTKTVRIYNASASYNGICVKNSESISAGDISSACTGSNEVQVKCDGTLTSGITCALSGTTLAITGLQYSGVIQYDIAATTTTTTTTTSGGNSGGGSVSGGGASSSTKNTTSVEVDMGGGKYCTVAMTRAISSADNLSVLTTTLENKGGADCAMGNFKFSETIPALFASIEDISFSPQPTSLVGWTAAFEFPVFVPGESNTITYSVSKWVPPSRVQEFTAYSLSVQKKAAAPPAVKNVTPPAPEVTKAPAPTVPTTKPLEGPAAAPAQAPAAPAPQQQGIIEVALMVAAVVLAAGALIFYLLFKRRRGL